MDLEAPLRTAFQGQRKRAGEWETVRRIKKTPLYQNDTKASCLEMYFVIGAYPSVTGPSDGRIWRRNISISSWAGWDRVWFFSTT